MEEACEHRLTRGTRFVARPLEVVVAVLLWIYFVVCFEWWDFVCVFFVFFFYFERTRLAASTYEPPLPHVSL